VQQAQSWIANMAEVSQVLLPVPGLRYVAEYLDQEGHDRLLMVVDAQPWQWLGQRRVQAHGYSYSQAKGGVYRIGELPPWASEVAMRLWRDGLMPEVADQMIVNEYQLGSGIPAHLDAAVFDDTIVSISLGSPCVIEFTDGASGRVEALLLEPRSALVMAGDSRHSWKHGIPARGSDRWLGGELVRTRRVSLTFRKMRRVSGALPA
jgi:alkylated DNA repair dioxygenase AlkB